MSATYVALEAPGRSPEGVRIAICEVRGALFANVVVSIVVSKAIAFSEERAKVERVWTEEVRSRAGLRRVRQETIWRRRLKKIIL